MNRFRVIASLAAGLALTGPAFSDCAGDRIRSCYEIEKTQPASGRGGLSASEFCAADAVAACASGAGRYEPHPPAMQSRETREPAYETKSRKTVAPAPAKAPEVKNLSEILVPGGKLRIVDGDPYETKSTIRYNDNLIHEFEGVYLSVRSVVFLEGEAVLTYSTNMGGSGSVDGYGLVSVNDKGKAYTADIPVGTGGIQYLVGNGRIAFELGIDEGMVTKAVYANGRLDVTRTKVPLTGLSAQNCDMLYNGYLEECADGRHSSCTDDGMQISMASQRPVNMLASDDPNFRRAEFDTVCKAACKAKKKPSLASFRKAICLPK